MDGWMDGYMLLVLFTVAIVINHYRCFVIRQKISEILELMFFFFSTREMCICIYVHLLHRDSYKMGVCVCVCVFSIVVSHDCIFFGGGAETKKYSIRNMCLFFFHYFFFSGFCFQ